MIFFALLGCTGGSEERTRRDMDVGLAEAGGVTFDVRDGLAVVHAAPHALELWAGAPTFVMQARAAGDAVADWTIDVNNAMVATELSVTPATTVTAHATERATHKRYRVVLEPNQTYQLAFSTPDAADRAPYRFALLSDVQEAIDRVQDIFDAIDAEPGLSFLLGAGDLSDRGTREELERFQLELESLSIPYYTTLGNHDAPSDSGWHDLYGRVNFRFVFRGVQFTLVDTAGATIDPAVYDWLAEWLDEGREGVHVVAMHIPPLDPVGVRNGAFGSRNEAGKVLAMLSEANVDLSLYGHIHSFYQFDNAGIPAFISGGGGALPERLDGIERHFMVFEVGADSGVLMSRKIEVD
ncbi:MAG TPA: metallophosphoesterase [Polyangiaceae bacterium]|nr:metallophosphoesterase [Polyangiaceae bacterium]